jgi:hypothetical protein
MTMGWHMVMEFSPSLVGCEAVFVIVFVHVGKPEFHFAAFGGRLGDAGERA